MNLTFASMRSDRKGFTRRFVDSIFQSGVAPAEDAGWMVAESMKTPTAVAVAIYSDFLMRDYTAALPTISVPTTVFAGNSPIFERGMEQGRWVADRIPNATFVPSERGGHILFWEDAQTFNSALADAVMARR